MGPREERYPNAVVWHSSESVLEPNALTPTTPVCVQAVLMCIVRKTQELP